VAREEEEPVAGDKVDRSADTIPDEVHACAEGLTEALTSGTPQVGIGV